MVHHRQRGDIVVRPFAAGDAPALLAAVRGSIASLSYWFPWCHAGYCLADAEARVSHCIDAWEAGTGFSFGIFSTSDEELLGCTGLTGVDRIRQSANLGYWVGEPYRGLGVATSAAALAASIGWEDLGLVRLEIVALPQNLASLRVAEKLGARREAQVRDGLVFQGRPAAGIVHSLSLSDMAAVNAVAPNPLRGSARLGRDADQGPSRSSNPVQE